MKPVRSSTDAGRHLAVAVPPFPKASGASGLCRAPSKDVAPCFMEPVPRHTIPDTSARAAVQALLTDAHRFRTPVPFERRATRGARTAGP